MSLSISTSLSTIETVFFINEGGCCHKQKRHKTTVGPPNTPSFPLQLLLLLMLSSVGVALEWQQSRESERVRERERERERVCQDSSIEY